MKTKNDFKELARRAYLSYHQDGIIDILVGLGIVGFGLMMLTGSVVFLMFAWVAPILYMPLKNRITVPRFGFVRFTGEQEFRRSMLIIMAVGVLTLSLVAGLGVFFATENSTPELRAFLGQYLMLILGGFLAIVAIAGAAITGVKRFYAYAIMTLSIVIAGIWMGIPEPYYVLLIGAIILTAGIWLLLKFLRKYPEPTEDWENAQG